MANKIEIMGRVAELTPSGVWTCEHSGVAADLKRECRPGQYSPAFGDPFAHAVNEAMRYFHAKLLERDSPAVSTADENVVY